VLTRFTLQEQAEQVIREMIVSHRFTAGARINVERLCGDLHVSRTPIIRALKKLKNEGLVGHTKNRGYHMAEMTLKMAVELYEVRELLEAHVGRLAASRIQPKTLVQMREILNGQRQIMEKSELLEYSKSDFEFHDLIYSSCGNSMLCELLRFVKSRARPLNIDITPILGELYQAHQKILAALEDRDEGAASLLMGGHTAQVRRLIESSQLEKGKNADPVNQKQLTEIIG
jgi:DNA-binding GntR family transcriptional regulator